MALVTLNAVNKGQDKGFISICISSKYHAKQFVVFLTLEVGPPSLTWHMMVLRKFHDLPLDVPHAQLIFSQAERSFITFEKQKSTYMCMTCMYF